MKKTVLLVFVIAFSFLIKAQTNLVPNPSFEIYSSCPTTLDLINLATGWKSFTHSSDYFNSCNGGVLGVPSNGLLYQPAFDGNAYAGILTCTSFAGPPSSREFFGAQLIQPLIIGQKYFVSFYASLANPPRDCWSNKIGAKFTTFNYDAPEADTLLINNFAHVYSDSLLKDSINWMQIKGTFVADSAYQFIILGNFFSDNLTDTLNCYGKYTYAAIDMVCVSTDSLTCNFMTGIIIEKKTDLYSVFPNPVKNNISIKSSFFSKPYEIIICNSYGQEIKREKINNSISEIDISVLSEGVFFLKIINNGSVLNYKLLKQNL